jgi:hypothetical protein
MRMPTNPSDQPPRRGSGSPDATPEPGHGLSVFPRRSSIGARTYFFDSRLTLFPRVTLPLRSMLVAASEHQFLISPVGTADEAAQIAAPPLILIAPSLLHHLQLPAAIERYHPVALWGPPGLAERNPELGRVYMFGIDAWPYDHELEFVLLGGAPQRSEVVFFHRVTRTIYTADLFFHIREPEGWLASLAFRVMGVHRRFAAPKMWRHWVTDRAAFARSIDEILAWDFDRIVVAHGDVVEHNAREQLWAALRERRLY